MPNKNPILKFALFQSSGSLAGRARRLVFFGVSLAFVLWLSYEFFFFLDGGCHWNYEVLPDVRSRIPWIALAVVPAQLFALYFSGLYRGVFAYFRMRELSHTVAVLTVCSLLLVAGMWVAVNSFELFPRSEPHVSVLIIDYFFSLIAVCGFRVFVRRLWEKKHNSPLRRPHCTNVAIFGAGDAGADLASRLQERPSLGRNPKFFLDDDPKKEGISVVGLPVFRMSDDLTVLQERFGVSELILATTTIGIRRSREVMEAAKKIGMTVLRVPSVEDLISKRVVTTDVREFAIEDLLERAPTKLDRDGILKMLSGKRVLVTGAGGSIGSEICRQVASCAPAQLLLVEQCEVLLYQIEQDLIRLGFGGVIVLLIADITDRERMTQIFEKCRPEFVFHAAAHKHVPMMESQPSEAIKNNALGSALLFELASAANVGAFVLISTDKAINPTNAMGASKRLAELSLLAYSRRPGNNTRFMAVRFGNVLGSSGSVIPLFKRQIAAGGPITVTHADIKRYFMTIPEAVGLVLNTALIGKGGSIYVLDMGAPVKIVDVAKHLIVLSGLRPGVDIEIKITGLRPGEKLFEELKTKGEEFEPSGHPRISRFISAPMEYEKLDGFLKTLREISQKTSRNEIKKDVQRIIPEYQPYLD